MSFMSIEERYRNDIMFRSIVEQLTHLFEQGEVTPTEVREACFLAQYMFEQRHGRPLTFANSNIQEWAKKFKIGE